MILKGYFKSTGIETFHHLVVYKIYQLQLIYLEFETVSFDLWFETISRSSSILKMIKAADKLQIEVLAVLA